jgi:hypothetical protein
VVVAVVAVAMMMMATISMTRTITESIPCIQRER